MSSRLRYLPRRGGSHGARVSHPGVRYTEKGFTVYVMKTDELDNFRRRVTFHHVPELEGLKIHSFTHRHAARRRMRIVVHNPEDLLRTMVVHLRVVIDPA
jgi:hypothetical protein